jgi:hypothetical protein
MRESRVYPNVSDSKQAYIRQRVTANQEKMKLWEHVAPMNYEHKFYLVEAERYRGLGSYVEAMDCYDIPEDQNLTAASI